MSTLVYILYSIGTCGFLRGGGQKCLKKVATFVVCECSLGKTFHEIAWQFLFTLYIYKIVCLHNFCTFQPVIKP